MYAGVDIGGTSVKLGFVDEEGRLARTFSTYTGAIAPELMAERVAALIADSGIKPDGIGIVTAGRVNPQTGYVDAGNLKWWAVPLRSIMEDKLGMPVCVDNDVQGALYAEWKTGVCRGVDNAVYIALGTGIGGAFIINGEFYRGRNHDGGEIGHMITHADGESCSCGGRGCFERYASAAALSRMAGGVNTRQVFAQAARGDMRMSGLLKRYTHELCIGIASVSVVFRPDIIVLGGGLSGAGAALLDPVMEELRTASPTIPRGVVPNVQLASLGNSAGVMGAALMAMDMKK